MKLRYLILVSYLVISSFAFSQENIFEVARFGSVEEVKELMTINSDTINSIDKTGYSVLTLACYRGNDDVAIFLAPRVKEINGNSKYGTPLMAAVYQNREAIVKVLIKNKADVNLADKNGTSPLHYAIIARNKNIIKLLVEAKADTKAKDKRGNTAEDYANMTQDDDIINLVLKKN